MLGQAKGSPTRKGVGDVQERIARLEVFERAAGAVNVMTNEALRDIVGAELWDRYWQHLDDLKALMIAAQREAQEIEAILSAYSAKTGSRGPR